MSRRKLLALRASIQQSKTATTRNLITLREQELAAQRLRALAEAGYRHQITTETQAAALASGHYQREMRDEQ